MGSGAIESAKKKDLQESLKQADRRGNRETARYIITLLTKEKCRLSGKRCS
jgi:hypothetical protein